MYLVNAQMSHCHTGKVGSDCKQNVCCIHGVMTSSCFIFILLVSGDWNVIRREFISNVIKQDLIQGHCLSPCVNIWKTQMLQLLENTYSALHVKFNFEQSVVCTTQVFRCWEYLPSFRLWDKLVRNNWGLFLILGTHFCCWLVETCKEIESKHWWFRSRCVCSEATQCSCSTTAKDATFQAKETQHSQ
jgi:hypothetical protein